MTGIEKIHITWISAMMSGVMRTPSLIVRKVSVEIGDSAIIGGNCYVNRNVPPYAMVAGSPGRIIKYRFNKQQIETLIKTKWWTWDNKDLADKRKLLLNPELFFNYCNHL